MYYHFEGTPNYPDVFFTETSIKNANGMECAYTNIAHITESGRGGKYTDEIIVFTQKNQRLSFSYQGKYRQEALDAIAQINAQIKRAKKERLAGSADTAEKMYRQCETMGCTCGMPEKWGVENFRLLEAALMPGEIVIFSFIGRHNLGDYFVYTVTNRRLIFGAKRLLGQVIKSVDLDKINDIELVSTFLASSIEFDFLKEKFEVYLPRDAAKTAYNEIHKALEEYRTGTQQNKLASQAAFSTKSPVEQLREYKSLLDDGILTQAEFDAKKRELLNL